MSHIRFTQSHREQLEVIVKENSFTLGATSDTLPIDIVFHGYEQLEEFLERVIKDEKEVAYKHGYSEGLRSHESPGIL